jgi:hypothetical protein
LGGREQEVVLKTVIQYGYKSIELDLSAEILQLGLDLHYRQVTVAMQEDRGRVTSVGKMEYRQFFKWIKKKLRQGWQIYSCYEAGASGYWLDRKLKKLGVANLVVVPKAMGKGGKKHRRRLKTWVWSSSQRVLPSAGAAKARAP